MGIDLYKVNLNDPLINKSSESSESKIDFNSAFNTNITQELLLKYNTEETYMEHYLGIPVKKGLFKSPLRKDNHPTCAFYRDSAGRLIFKDFKGDFYGNFIEVVKFKYNVSYSKALAIIANDFGIRKNTNLPINKSCIKEYTNNKLEYSEGSVIRVKIKDFTDDELKWWGNYGISLNTLKKFFVFSIELVYLNNEIFSFSSSYKYQFGYYYPTKDDKQWWRIYYPKNKSNKWISNWKKNMIQGIQNIPKSGKYLVITKSLKDVMCLYELGIPAIAPTSENLFISDQIYDKLIIKFKKIFLLYDNDLAGIKNMNKIRKKHSSIIPIFIPRKYKAKDISDFYKKYGSLKTFDLIEEVKNKYL